MSTRFVVEFDRFSNEGRLRPRHAFDWPPDVFTRMRGVYQLSYSHDKTRVFVGTVPQVEAACRWLAAEGLSVGSAGQASVSTAHPPVVCGVCLDLAYRVASLPPVGTPCEACGEPLTFVCDDPHPNACQWREAAS